MNESLVERIKQCPSLPSLPSVAMEVLDLAQRPDVEIPEIAQAISKDPALAGKILRTVNSSFYGRSQHVGTLSHALVILGLQSVKTLVLGFSLVRNLTQGKDRGFKHLTYWRRSVYAATAARTLAGRVGIIQQEEVFLTALLSDIGVLVLDQVLGEQYDAVHAAVSSHGELVAAERAALGMTHADVGGILAEQWKLPPVLSVPIAQHHSPDVEGDATLRDLAELAQVAQRCADVFVDEQPAAAIADVRAAVLDRYQMDAAACDALLEEIGLQTKEVASLFEINIGPGVTFEAILKRADEALATLAAGGQQPPTAPAAEQDTGPKPAPATVPAADPASGLASRAVFDAFLAEQFADARASNRPLAVLLVHADELVSGTHGPAAPDAVLRAIGALLKSAARAQDLTARYANEELCLALPGVTRKAAAAIAETVRQAVAARPVHVGATRLPITASVGVAAVEPGDPFREPAHLLKAAELAVYAAKNGGRNCVKVFALPRPNAKPAAA